MLNPLTTRYYKHCKYHKFIGKKKLDDGWPESEKDVFQAALRMREREKERGVERKHGEI